MADTVQQIKDRLSIVDVVSQYVKLDRAGANMRARCPFHVERTPSFMVSPERGTYHCFGCNVGGDMFSFVQAIEGVDFKGALKILAERAGVPLVYERIEKTDERDRLYEIMETATLFYAGKLSEKATQYLRERGLKDGTIQAFRIGLASDEWEALSKYLTAKKFSQKEILDAGLAKKSEKGGLTDKFRNRIMFPISDSAGRVIAFSGRTFGVGAHPDAPKYLNSPETPLFQKSRVLYGFDKAKSAIRKHNFSVLVEGQMDLLASHQAGWVNTVAVSGTAFTPEHAALVKRMSENLVIALDPDEAGFKAAVRASRAALQQGLQVKVARLPSGLDPADLILKEGPEAWRKSVREAKDIITFLLDVLEDLPAGRQGTQGTDRFRRAVETIVLPFLADIQSPIARDHYIKEIAKRLGVSETAVSEAHSRSAHATAWTPQSKNVEEKVHSVDSPNRIKQAYGLLLWQETMRKPTIDTDEFAKELEDAIGHDAMKQLKALSLEDKETLRFFADKIFTIASALEREAQEQLHILKRDRLRKELSETADAQKKADRAGNEKEENELSKKSRVLTEEIAKLSKGS